MIEELLKPETMNNEPSIRKHRANGASRRLRRIEDKLDIILSEMSRLHIRLLKLERLRQENLIDSAINRLYASTIRMKKMSEKEYQAIYEIYGVRKEVKQ